MKKKLLHIYLVTIFIFTVAPIHLLLPNFEQDKWQNPFLLHFPPDKIAHFFIYFILGLLIILNFNLKKKYYMAGLLYGILMETIQYPISFRTFELVDLLANIVGLSCSYGLTLLKKPSQSSQ